MAMQALDLLQTQKNEILKVVVDKGFNPTDFSWSSEYLSRDRREGIADAFAPKLSHVSGYWILYDMRGGPRAVFYSPGRRATRDGTFCMGNWGTMRSNTGLWLDNLKREIEAPDLWAMAAEQREQLEAAAAPGTENTPFTPQEREYISAKLDEIKAQLTETHQLQAAAVRLLEEQFEFLKEESKKQGRRGWIQMALGVVLSFALTKVDPAAAHQLLSQMVQAVTPLVTRLLAAGGP